MTKQLTKNAPASIAEVTVLFGKFAEVFAKNLYNLEQKIDQRFEALEQKVDANHAETTDFFVAMKKDFDRLDDKVTVLDKKVATIDDRLASVEILCTKNEHHWHELDLNINKRFDRLETVVFPKTRGRLSLAV